MKELGEFFWDVRNRRGGTFIILQFCILIPTLRRCEQLLNNVRNQTSRSANERKTQIDARVW